MISLTRLNNQQFVLNADLIKFIENSPDTVITLLTGEKLVVRESVDQVLQRISEFHLRYYRRIGAGIVADPSSPEVLPPGGQRSPNAQFAKDKSS